MHKMPEHILSALEDLTVEIEFLTEMVDTIGAAADLVPSIVPASAETLQ